MSLRVAFTGGGTGGHIYPALAIDESLRATHGGDYEGRFLGSRGGLEARLVTAMPLVFVPSAPLARRASLGTLRTAVANAGGIAVALRALAEFRPHGVVATGGYVGFPVVVAARILRLLGVVPCAIAVLESNVAPGLTNTLLAPLADEIWAAYDASLRGLGRKAIVTGMPTRAGFRSRTAPAAARVRLGLEPDRTTVVVMGGSQGARSINEAAAALVTRRTLPSDWQVLHLCGERDYAYMRAEEREPAPGNAVRLVPYLDDPADAYAAADVVIARAGASTLAELAETGSPAILVPYPYAAEQHQARNAQLFEQRGAAMVVADRDLDGDRLWWTLREVLDPGRNAVMRTAARGLATDDAAATIAARVTALAARRGGGAAAANERGP